MKFMPKEIRCPECRKRGRAGTLGLLSDDERQRLIELGGKDTYPEKIYGCDECKYWIAAENLEDIL